MYFNSPGTATCPASRFFDNTTVLLVGCGGRAPASARHSFVASAARSRLASSPDAAAAAAAVSGAVALLLRPAGRMGWLCAQLHHQNDAEPKEARRQRRSGRRDDGRVWRAVQVRARAPYRALPLSRRGAARGACGKRRAQRRPSAHAPDLLPAARSARSPSR
eukprot:6614234-Prymnesium_polylepis.1